VTRAVASPTVLVLGGFLTIPPLYRRMAARLRDRGAAEVVVAPLWTPEWVLAGVRDFGRVLGHAELALDRAVAIASEASKGAPVLVVGHSAGGLVARLLTSPQPFVGRALDRRREIGTIVTLGTPHQVAPAGFIAGRIGRLAAAFADEVVPGACFAPEVGYVAVGASGIPGLRRGFGRGRIAEPFYRRLHPAPDGRSIEGDGLVPLACTELPGARQIVLGRIGHGQLGGLPWYGSPEAVDAWWPVALDAWREAVAAREGVGLS
jgi:PGAP1-like protein